MLNIERKGQTTSVTGFRNTGKTNYLLGYAYRYSLFGKKVLWLNTNNEITPNEIATIIDCFSLEDLNFILRDSAPFDLIVLDDPYLIESGLQSLATSLIANYESNIPKKQERIYSRIVLPS